MFRGTSQAVILNFVLDDHITRAMGIENHVCELQLVLQQSVDTKVTIFCIILSRHHIIDGKEFVRLLLNRTKYS